MTSERLINNRSGSGDVHLIQSPEISSTSISNHHLLRRNPSPFPRCRRPLRTPDRNMALNRVPFINQNENRNVNGNLIDVVNIEKHRYGTSTRFAVLGVALIFLLSLMALFYVYMKFPELDDDERQHIHIPWDIEGAKQLGIVLDRYKERYFFEVLSGVCVTYIFLQTFAIPGSLFLSILSGFLFPFMLALILVCCCSAIGASLCYLLSQLLGRRLVKRFFPERAEKWAITVHKHRDHIFNYILFLRVTPFLPNWFINLVAPVIGVPLVPFALGTFIGVGPPSFVAIQAGQTLYKMSSSNDAFSWSSVVLLSVFALLSLVPVLLKKRLRDKFE